MRFPRITTLFFVNSRPSGIIPVYHSLAFNFLISAVWALAHRSDKIKPVEARLQEADFNLKKRTLHKMSVWELVLYILIVSLVVITAIIFLFMKT